MTNCQSRSRPNHCARGKLTSHMHGSGAVWHARLAGAATVLSASVLSFQFIMAVINNACILMKVRLIMEYFILLGTLSLYWKRTLVAVFIDCRCERTCN